MIAVIGNIDGYLNAFDEYCIDNYPDNPNDYKCNNYVDFIVVKQ